jgi:hypothetical protein
LLKITTPYDTPNFGRYVANGWHKPENNYTLFKEKVVNPNGYPHLKITWIPTGDFSEYYGPAASTDHWGDIRYLEPTTAERAVIASRLSAKLLQKIKGQKVNLGVFTATRHQTLKLVGDTMLQCVDAVKALKRGNFKKAFDALRCPPSKRVGPHQSVAGNWLALQYGWEPLLDDCYGAANELERAAAKIQNRPPILTVGAKTRWQASDMFDSVVRPGAKAHRQCIADFRRRVYYIVEVPSSQQLGRLGLTNPFDIAWDILPWSFVVDWFLPVGTFLNTLDATLGCSFVSGSDAGRISSRLDYSRHSSYDVGNFRYKFDIENVSGLLIQYERAALGGFPTVQLPQWKNPLSRAHAANALALLTQAFSRR